MSPDVPHSITSRGLHAIAGREAHPRAQETTRDLGTSLAERRTQPLPDMMEPADCVFALDFQNTAELLGLDPTFRDKIYMFTAYVDGPRRFREISDPYHGDIQVTRLCGQQLQTCVRNLMQSLFQAPCQAARNPDSRQPGLRSAVKHTAHAVGPIGNKNRLLS